jgi:hypothetical protein
MLPDRLVQLAKLQNNRIDKENTASEYREHRPISGQNDDDADRNSDCTQEKSMSAWLYPSIHSQKRSYDKKLIKPTGYQASHQHSRHTHIGHPRRRQENHREMPCGSERFSKTHRRNQHCGFPEMVHPALTAEDPKLAAFEPATAAALDT